MRSKLLVDNVLAAIVVVVAVRPAHPAPKRGGIMFMRGVINLDTPTRAAKRTISTIVGITPYSVDWPSGAQGAPSEACFLGARRAPHYF